MSDYFNVTTNVGDAAIATAIANNSKLNITHIAFGDGNGSVPTPTKTRTSLVREVHRQAVTKYAMHPTIANYIVIETIIPSNIGGFWIREMGIIADTVLISHGSHAPFFKVADPDGVSEYRLKFTQNIRDGNVVEISLDESLIYASQAWVNENYIRRNELVDNLTTDDAKKPVSAKQAKNLQDNKLDKTANAVSSSKLETARTISFSGAATGSFNFDGSGNSSCILALANSGVVANTYGASLKIPTITVNAKGLITGVSEQNIPIVDNLTTDDSTKPVSAKQAKDLQDNKLDKTANAVSASKLKNARKINNVDFNGEQDIGIEAPLRFVSHITTLEQLNAAVDDGKYTVSGLTIAGLYSYGFLVVLRNGGVCHQTYYPHLGSDVDVISPNNGTMAMRQAWNDAWSGWRVVGTRDDSKLPLAGGTLTGGITIDTPELVLRHNPSGRYLYINNGDWGVYSPQGAIPLPVGSGGTGNLEGRAPSADRLATPRNIFGQTFDGLGDVGGTISASTGLVQTDNFHFIDMGRAGLDRMNFYNYGAIFNFIDSQNGNIVARLNAAGIDCNAASASKLKTPRNIALTGAISGNANFDGSGNITINTELKENTAVVRAFCSFNGTGAPVILAESNIASISVSSLKFTVTFKTPMPHANYVINGFASDVTNSNRVAVITMNPDMIPSKTVNGFDFYARYSSNASTNIASPLICFSIVC